MDAYLVIGAIVFVFLLYIAFGSKPATPPCTPVCAGKVCGDDGCSGTCGSCPASQSCVSGQCAATTIICSDSKPCPDGQICLNGFCTTTGPCFGRQCGVGNDGSTCPSQCTSTQTCINNQCTTTTAPPNAPILTMADPFYYCDETSTKDIITWKVYTDGTQFTLDDLVTYIIVQYPDGTGGYSTLYNDVLPIDTHMNSGGVNFKLYRNDILSFLDFSQTTHYCYLYVVSISTSLVSAQTPRFLIKRMNSCS